MISEDEIKHNPSPSGALRAIITTCGGQENDDSCVIENYPSQEVANYDLAKLQVPGIAMPAAKSGGMASQV